MFPWQRAAEWEEVRCVVYFALSGCSDPDDCPIAQSGTGDWGHLWSLPLPASANTVQPTGTQSICMLCRTPTKHRHKLGFHIQIVCTFHLLFLFPPVLWYRRTGHMLRMEARASRSVWFISLWREEIQFPCMVFVYRSVAWNPITSNVQGWAWLY